MAAFGAGVAFFFIIALRLWYLQVIHGDEFRVQSENNRLRTVYVPPPRGLILDRNGQVLVKNRPSFNIEFISEDSPDPKETLHALAEITGVPEESLKDRMKDSRKRRRFEPKVLLRDVDRDVLAKVTAQKYRLPGVIVNVVPARDYIYGSLAAHALGYIREITQAQLERPKFAGYIIGDQVGQYGIEREMEVNLQGKRGMQAVIVDASGNRIGEASFEPDAPGHAVNLTLDLDVQKAAEEAMDQRRGAVIALDPNTGEVLAMVSHPAFDPNMFTRELSAEDWKDLNSDKTKKLNNRTIQGTYPPGSVFKVFMSAAGLATGTVTPKQGVSCPGFFPFAGRDYRCWKKTGHGPVDLYSAIVQSCDVYFYSLGNKLQIDTIHEYMNRFGLGRKTGIELGDEAEGLVPSSAWKQKTFHERWYPGETISVSIGQGAVTLTPIQIARGLSALVNGGTLYKPYLVKKVASADGTYSDDTFGPTAQGNVDIKPELLQLVRNGMEGVVEDPRGTAHSASLMKEYGIKVGGKTGTAQVAALAFHKKGTALDDHAWFAGYAPTDKPEIVVVTLVENGGHGGSAAAPVVKHVMDAFFKKRMPRLIPEVTPTPQSAQPAPNDVPEEHDQDHAD